MESIIDTRCPAAADSETVPLQTPVAVALRIDPSWPTPLPEG